MILKHPRRGPTSPDFGETGILPAVPRIQGKHESYPSQANRRTRSHGAVGVAGSATEGERGSGEAGRLGRENFIDVYFREGRYKSPLPLILGQEGAGIVNVL